ncbi:hypothetical protein DVK44_15630 [Streptomyces paludis]|uniref:Peptidase n=1 Tax=Streptomyces paludis TaxID=2282738 RepID=A0A345I0Z5_9ACTN|nr:hypothetical protein [Streptomyces paludis]AXG82619.1 hypothetical protein DVK44_15630 [Streptomyces paludis]
MCAAAALCAVAALPGTAGRAWAAGEPAPYAFGPDTKPVTGSATTSGARPLDAGATYKDTIEPGGRRIYRLDLDAETNAYVSAVAVPKPGTTVAPSDNIKVSLQNGQGNQCSSNDARFGGVGAFPRPLAAYAYRTVEKGSYLCKDAGRYYVVVERTSDETSTPEPWELEIRHVAEPGLTEQGPTSAPTVWPSASPGPAAGDRTGERKGGSSFYDAKGLSGGEWTTGIEPGASLFYRIPVDWGQQLFVAADLSSSEVTDGPAVSGAFAVSLYNPALGLVGSGSPVSYDGRQKTVALSPLPPVAYENRFGYATGDKDMRFAGWYYLRVSLNPEVATSFGTAPIPLTLRVNVTGEAKPGPAYAGPAGDFGVTPDDREVAADGLTPSDRANGDTMALIAAAGIGTGTALVLGLGVWTLRARRNAAGGAAGGVPAQVTAGPSYEPQGYGPQGYGPPPGR